MSANNSRLGRALNRAALKYGVIRERRDLAPEDKEANKRHVQRLQKEDEIRRRSGEQIDYIPEL